MPHFDLIGLDEARSRAATGRRAQITREYIGYIEQLDEGQAGKLRPAAGETVATVRRRLGASAKLAGKEVTIKRVGEEIFFWVEPQQAVRRRRGRRPKGTTQA